jgi:23S rRNA pseudouridine1911/1915/1917 synthase
MTTTNLGPSVKIMTLPEIAYGICRPLAGRYIPRHAMTTCGSFGKVTILWNKRPCRRLLSGLLFRSLVRSQSSNPSQGTMCTLRGPLISVEDIHQADTISENKTVSDIEEDCPLIDDEDADLFTVLKSESGQRLDRLLSERYTGQSRSYFQLLIDEGLVQVNGRVATSKAKKAELGDQVFVKFMTLVRDIPLEPENIDMDILFEDEHLVIINKPAGMVVHPAPGNWTGTMVHGLAFRYKELLNIGGPRPGVVHRLDKGTSGLIIAARTTDAHRALTAMFAQRQIEKTYLAITVGNPAGTGCTSTRVDVPIGRSRVDRLRMTVMAEEAGGKPARSLVEVLAHDERALLHVVRVGLETGRTHQIRVHLRHVRAPVLGDDLYGAFDINRRFRSAAERPMLHAHRLRFQHPFTGNVIDMKARLPEDMRNLLARNVYPSFEVDQPEW